MDSGRSLSSGAKRPGGRNDPVRGERNLLPRLRRPAFAPGSILKFSPVMSSRDGPRLEAGATPGWVMSSLEPGG